MLFTQSLVNNKNVTRELAPSLVIPDQSLGGRHRRRYRHAETSEKWAMRPSESWKV